ncbi:MAG: 50S ribosomal protein L7 [Ruminococcaceae bacterium]|nr:50S ribosomal protein L7 [Oscillospiraceae bacterium]
MNKALSLLGLAKRAGKLCTGFDPVKESLLSGTARLVLFSTDLSEKTVDRVRYLCSIDQIPILPLPTDSVELTGAVGKRCGVCAVTDRGFAQALSGILSNRQEEN